MQLSVSATMPGLQRGMPIGPSMDGIATRFNQRSETRTITVTYASGQTHTVTIGGNGYDGGASQSVTIGPITGLTDSATAAQAILAAIRASAVGNSIVEVTRNSNVLTLVSRRPGPLTVTGSATGGAATTVATTVSEEQLEAGVAIVKDSVADKAIRKPFTNTLQVATLSFTAVNSTLYSFVLRSEGYGTVTIEFTSDASATAAEIAQGLSDRVNALPVPVTGSVSTNDLVLTADVAGDPFFVTEVSANITQAATVANVANAFDGVTLWPKLENSTQSLTGNNVWPSKSLVDVMRRGRLGVYVEAAVTPASEVYFRHVASGANTVLGAFRGDSDSGTCTKVPNGSCAFFTSASAGGVASLDVNLP